MKTKKCCAQHKEEKEELDNIKEYIERFYSHSIITIANFQEEKHKLSVFDLVRCVISNLSSLKISSEMTIANLRIDLSDKVNELNKIKKLIGVPFGTFCEDKLSDKVYKLISDLRLKVSQLRKNQKDESNEEENKSEEKKFFILGIPKILVNLKKLRQEISDKIYSLENRINKCESPDNDEAFELKRDKHNYVKKISAINGEIEKLENSKDEKILHCCPICLGRRKVQPLFYNISGSASSVGPELKCKTCKREGIVWS